MGRGIKAGKADAFSAELEYDIAMATKNTKTNLAEDSEDAEFLAAVNQGIASLDAGRGIPYEKIRRWLLSWGTENELPPPK